MVRIALIVAAVLAAAVALVRFGYSSGKAAGDAERAALVAEYERKANEAQAWADARYRAAQAETTRIAGEYSEQLRVSKKLGDLIVDDLRADNLRLRAQWRGCEDRAGVQDSAATAGSDDAAELRAEGAGDLVRAGADADAQVKALQEYARTCAARS